QTQHVMDRVQTGSSKVVSFDRSEVGVEANDCAVRPVEARWRKWAHQRVHLATEQELRRQLPGGRQLNVGWKDSLRTRGIGGVARTDGPVDRIDPHSLLPQSGPTPRVAGRRPVVGPDALSGQVSQVVEPAPAPDEETSVAEPAIGKEGDGHEGLVSINTPAEGAAERQLAGRDRGIGRGAVGREWGIALEGQVDPPGSDLATRQGSEKIIVLHEESD